MDAMMVPTASETDGSAPYRSFKIKPDFANLRIGFVEPSIWKTWRKSGRINADAERFMVSRPENQSPPYVSACRVHRCV
jgi:amidase